METKLTDIIEDSILGENGGYTPLKRMLFEDDEMLISP